MTSLRVRRTAAPIIGMIAASALLVGCSKEPAPANVPSAPSTPLVEQSAADSVQPATEEFRGSLAPGGVAAKYRAIFNEGQIQRLEETRPERSQETSQTATYEFQGARLMKYSGVALGSNDTVELEFDLTGKVLTARAGDRPVSSEEISAIRDRAQSLRSHAVSQHAVRGHGQK